MDYTVQTLASVGKVIEIMDCNVEKVLERDNIGEGLGELSEMYERADNLQEGASQFLIQGDLESRKGVQVTMDLDLILKDIGELGRWHAIVLLCLIPPALLPAMWSVIFIFAGYVPDYRCYIDGCDGPNSSFVSPWLNYTTPRVEEGGEEMWSRCTKFSHQNSSEEVCAADQFTQQVITCDKFIFDDSLFQSSVVTEFELVCDGHNGQVLVDLGYSMHSVGVLIGTVVPSLLSDRFGRKTMMFASMLVAAVSLISTAFVKDYTTFLILRVVEGVGTLGAFVTMCVLSVEITSNRYKSLVGNIMHIFWAPGEMLLALTAFFIRDWRTLYIAISIPVFLSLLLWPVMPESPRWLVATGHNKRAHKVLVNIAKYNGRPPPPDLPSTTGNTTPPAQPSSIPSTSQPSTTKASALDLVSSWAMVSTTAVLSLNWLVVNFCYYGLSLHSVNLSGDIFINFVLSAAVEMPAVLLGMFGMDWIGRVPMLVLGQCVGGGACILAGFLKSPYILPLSLVGKLSSSIVFLTVYLYTAEIYPTNIRGLGMAVTATMARVGGFLAPFIVGLGVTNQAVPFLVFGGTAILGGVAAFSLPETRGSPLPANMDDVNAILQKKTWCFRKKTLVMKNNT